MRILYLTSILIVLIFNLSFGQKIGDYYVSIPSDSMRDCRLKFLSDSTVELSNVPRHMASGIFKMVFKFTNKIDKVEILTGVLTTQDSLSLSMWKLNFFIKPWVNLSKIDEGFIDYSNSIFYLRENDLVKKTIRTYIVNGKTFKQDEGETNIYGHIITNPKKNKSLQKELDIVGINPDKYKIEIIKGWKAYQRFGIQTVYGVFLISKK
jgi:hypothetical protein